jgi:electron transfer flavoprotein alpha subunit
MTNDILVFIEQREGKLHPAALQCFTPARQLASQTGGRVVAVLIGDDLATPASQAAACADHVLTIADASLKHYSATRYRTALAAAIAKVQPRVVLLIASFLGRDLAPRAAVRTGSALATDVIELKLGGDGVLDARRPIYNGKAFGHVQFPRDRTAICSLRANTFAAPAGASGAATIESLPFAASPGDERIEVKEVVRAGGSVKDVTEADIVVSGGRSLKSAENFEQYVYPLAAALDGAVGASRAACDAGYQPHSRQVGLTGKTVTPKLYVACGISGAIQHLAGMRGSKVIVAINSDAEAPIFKVADYGIVGDLFQVVPKLTEEVRKLHG